MKKLITFVIILILIPVFFALLLKRVPPATIGVKQSNWGTGIIEKDYATGFHIGISGIHKWYMMPRKTHFIHFTESRQVARDSETDTYNAPLKIRTLDNNVVTIDVSVSYHILQDSAYKIVKEGLQASYRDRVKSKALGVLRAELPKLSSEDLQSTEMRLKQVQDTLPILNLALADFHCVAESILIRRIGFPSDYEAKLQDKQYLNQKANLDIALTLQAEEEKLVNVIDKKIQADEMKANADWEKKLQEKASEYEVLIAQIAADAEVYASRTRAEGEAGRVIAEANGQLAIEKAEALRNQLRTEALNSAGGSILLGLQAAENLNMPSVTLNSDDPAVPIILDLDQLTSLLIGGGSKLAGKK
jgi:regulator of protease activity HflC (stomatin/prohibitin superfamily)